MPDQEQQPRLLPIRAAAVALNVHPATVRRAIERGELPAAGWARVGISAFGRRT